MCRLFGMVGAGNAKHWLLEAPNSMRALGEWNPHGVGVGGFVDGKLQLDKSALRASQDPLFGNQEWLDRSDTIVSHVRDATVSGPAVQNSHPFEMHGRLFAQNGSIGDLARLDKELGSARSLVRGNTDSERYAALVARNIERNGGDVEAGIAETVNWLADTTPMTSINFVMTTPTDMWALRYPDARELFVNRIGLRDAAQGQRLLLPEGASGTRPGGAATLVASEPLDAEAGWIALKPGQLLHVRAGDLREEITQVIDREPKFRLDNNFRSPDSPPDPHLSEAYLARKQPA
ncbi:MAG: Glutamine amidotransferase [Thermoleophilia bacterium]|nr:Glutamine amidotransferase [Thermoleophilia bacterium]